MPASNSPGRQGSQPSRPVRQDWRPGTRLTNLEEEVRRRTAAGERVDLGAGPFDLAAMKAWGKRRTIRAAVLRHLLVNEEWPVHSKGVRLRGIRISGRLDLEAAALRCPLRLEDCYLSNPRPVILDYATVLQLTLTGCHLAGLSGDTVMVAKDLSFKGSTLTGPLRLPDANITGQLTCRGTQLTGADSDGNALSAWRIKIGGDVFLDGGFAAAGAVLLSGADITGQLTCQGARLTDANSDGHALSAERIQVGGHALLDHGFTAVGAVLLSSAQIAGQLNCRGAQLNGADKNGDALVALRTRVGGDVFLDRGFSAAGAVLLSGADIAGQLSCRGAQLTVANSNHNALVASRMRVGSDLFLNEKFTAAGAVLLSGADIAGQLNFRGAQLNGADSDGDALIADGIRVGGNVFLNEKFTAAGAVLLSGADIAGQLNFRGAQLNGADSDGDALIAEQMRVGRYVFLERFTAAGAILLSDTSITGQLSCSGARLTAANSDGNALVADGMRVGGDVWLDERFTAAGAVLLADADITGLLGCGSAQLNGADSDGDALLGDRIRVGGDVLLDEGFTAAGAIRLSGADIGGQLSCSGARLTGANTSGNALVARRITVRGNVYLDENFTATGTVLLTGANVIGQLDCRTAQLNGTSSEGYALAAGGIRVGRHALIGNGFTAAGAVLLADADITGQLNLRGAQLNGADSDGDALIAYGIRIGSNVFLDGNFTAAGAIVLTGANIAGQLSCSSAQLTAANTHGHALAARGVRVGGVVFLDDGFTAAGTVSLRSARLDGSLWLMPSKLAQGEGIPALDATGAQVAHELRWAPSRQIFGQVCLENSTVGQLEDDWTPANGSANGYWPSASQGLLRLDGFNYGRISGQYPASVDQRLAWIGSQSKRAHRTRTTAFATQPYEQLTKVYQQAGQDAEARKVAIARRRDLRRYGNLTGYRKAANWLLDITIRYGYQTWRAVVGLVAVYAVVLTVFWLAQYRTGLIVPAQDVTSLRPAPVAARCTSQYPCFSAVGYAIDTVVPFINVHQADHWRPNASVPDGWILVYLTWAGIGLGWALATLVVAGYTGLVRNSDTP